MQQVDLSKFGIKGIFMLAMGWRKTDMFQGCYAVAKKMKHLTEKDLSLFTLEDFVQPGTDTSTSEDESASTEELKDEAQPTLI